MELFQSVLFVAACVVAPLCVAFLYIHYKVYKYTTYQFQIVFFPGLMFYIDADQEEIELGISRIWP